jgi:GT2 family glycosyltransferase
MKILICQLTYGDRPFNILIDNELKAGYNATYCQINTEGISNALNEGIDYMLKNEYDAIGFLANDIIEPQDWLSKKVEALTEYPNAGVVASSLDHNRTNINCELIISNWLISRQLIQKIGFFNETMFPYGPIDLDYCERAWAAGYKTYYVMDCLAVHTDTPVNYGWDKSEMVAKYWDKFNSEAHKYKSGELDYFIKRSNGTT